MIDIVKRGSMRKNHREFIVIKFDEDTEAQEIIDKFGKEYEPSWSRSHDDDGKVLKMLYKRDKPVDVKKLLKNPLEWL